MKYLYICAFLFAFAAPAFGQDKNAEWLTGTVLDSDRSSRVVGANTTVNRQDTQYGTYGSAHTNTQSVVDYFFYISGQPQADGTEILYTIRRILRFRWDKDPVLTVNGPVKYRIDKKGKFYILDENNREMKFEVIKKVLWVSSDQKPKP
jgi:hypothetical protein